MDVSIIPEIGGGPAYGRRVTESDADTVVTTPSELVNELETATNGDVVYVPGDLELDMTGYTNINPGANNVTLASNRGEVGDHLTRSPSHGARLWSKDYSTDHPNRLIKARTTNFRVSGLRLRGPTTTHITTYDDTKEACAIWFFDNGGEVDNCELYGWPFAALSLGGIDYPDCDLHVHHNHVHHNRMEGLGYGIDIYNGFSLWEFNYMGAHRHSVAGLGYDNCAWECRYNVISPYAHGFQLDMHGQNDGSGSPTAGRRIDSHHNTFMYTEEVNGSDDEALKIRGVPLEISEENNNWYRHNTKPVEPGSPGEAYYQETVSAWQNFDPENSYFDESEPSNYFMGAPRYVECDHNIEWIIHGPPEPVGASFDPTTEMYEKNYNARKYTDQ